jgi:type 1 glutamine amidotransferase
VNCDKYAAAFPDMPMIWDARKGAAELFATYTRLGLALEDFEGPRYKRIAKIQQLMSDERLTSDLRWTTEVPLATV